MQFFHVIFTSTYNNAEIFFSCESNHRLVHCCEENSCFFSFTELLFIRKEKSPSKLITGYFVLLHTKDYKRNSCKPICYAASSKIEIIIQSGNNNKQELDCKSKVSIKPDKIRTLNVGVINSNSVLLATLLQLTINKSTFNGKMKREKRNKIYKVVKGNYCTISSRFSPIK